MRHELLEAFKDRLKGSGQPCLMEWTGNGEQLLSASALWNLSLERRHQLRALGLRPGDICLDTSYRSEAIINLLACLHGSFVYCPRQLPLWEEGAAGLTRRVARVLADGTITLEETRVPQKIWSDDGFASLLATSGTSRAQARPVLLTEAAILHQLKTHAAVLPVRADQNRLVLLPGHHSFGLILDRLLGLYAQQNLFFYSEASFHPRRVWDLMEAYDIEWIALVPRTLQLLGQYLQRVPQARDRLKKLHVHGGGAFLGPDERAAWQERLAMLVWGYGLTECGPGVLINGVPVGCDVQLRPCRASPVPDLAELWVKTPALGLWLGGEDSLDQGYYPTGDLAHIGAQGRIEVLGRSQDCFKSSQGEWVHFHHFEHRIKHEFRLSSVHVKLAKTGAAFEIRALINGQGLEPPSQLLERLLSRLRSQLPLPCEIFLYQLTPELADQLAKPARKSLGEALEQLMLEPICKSA